MATILGQRCTVFLDEQSVQRFKIESSIDEVLPGDLPIYGPAPYTSNVFVHQIVAPTDPKQDTFLRVANVADLTTLPQGRESALSSGKTIYLSANFVVIYDDIATANQAKLLIQQRVDNLIADWHAYNEQFLYPLNAPTPEGPPYTYSDITLPLTTSIVSERQDAYNAAHAELLDATATSAVAAVTLTAATATASAANDNATSAVAESQKCSTLLGQYNSGIAPINTFRTQMNNLLTQSKLFDSACTTYQAAVAVYRAIDNPGSGDETALDTATGIFNGVKATWQAAITAATTASQAEAVGGQPVMTTFATNMSAACTTKISEVAIAADAKTEADRTAADAATEKKAADKATAAALAADTAAFLALQEVCPTAERTVP